MISTLHTVFCYTTWLYISGRIKKKIHALNLCLDSIEMKMLYAYFHLYSKKTKGILLDHGIYSLGDKSIGDCTSLPVLDL